MSAGGLALAVLAVAALPVAAARASESSDRAAVSQMALTRHDVPRGFAQTVSLTYDRWQIAAQGTWTLRQLSSWGYVAGHENEFDRDTHGNDPAQLSSDVGAYRTPDGARRALAANGDKCQVFGWTELAPPAHLGVGSHACTKIVTARGRVGRVFFVVWRIGRFKGSITLTGIKGSFGVDDAIGLSHRQSGRMKQVIRRM